MQPAYRILIVDDEDDIVDILASTLGSLKAEIHTAGSGDAALKLLLAHRYDLILTDIFMPGINGIDFIKKLNYYALDSEIIVVSGGGEWNHRNAFDQAKHLGVAAIFEKPFDTGRIREKVIEIAQRTRGKGLLAAS